MDKESYFESAENRLNEIKYVGYNYKNNIFRKTLSKVLFTDPDKIVILQKIESMIYFSIQQVKSIKRFVNFTVSKNYEKFN